MLRLYLLQNLYNLSDMQTAEQVIDSRAFSNFCSISSPEEVPDEDTIGRFRNLLIKARAQEILLRKKKEHQKSSVRAKVEHVFSVIKNLFSFRKTRYRGKRKQFAKLNFLFALANLYLADRRFGIST